MRRFFIFPIQMYRLKVLYPFVYDFVQMLISSRLLFDRIAQAYTLCASFSKPTILFIGYVVK